MKNNENWMEGNFNIKTQYDINICAVNLYLNVTYNIVTYYNVYLTHVYVVIMTTQGKVPKLFT
jgi:hypothetical protein